MRIFILVVLTVLLSTNVLAIGLSPSSASVDYEQGLSTSVSLRVVPSGGDEKASVSLGNSNLAEYVTISRNEIDFTDPNDNGEVIITIDIPNNDKNFVGVQSINVEARGIRQEKSTAMVSATAIVVVPIKVYFPYPGKYVDINSFNVESINEGVDSSASWILQSRGNEAVSVTAKLEVYDSNNDLFFEKTTQPVLLFPNQMHSEQLTIPLKDRPSGNYYALLKINYEDDEKNKSKNFGIGTMDVDLTEYFPKELNYNSINEMKFMLLNKWNGVLDNIYGEINIAGKKAKTPSTMLESLKGGSITHYLDVSGVDPGNYSGTFTVYFEDNSKEFPIEISILDEIETQKKLGTYEEPADYSTLIIIIVGIIVVIIIALFLYRKYSEKNE